LYPFVNEVQGMGHSSRCFSEHNSKLVHEDRSIFGDATQFRPERRLDPDSKWLEQFLVPFSKGGRECLGKNFALAKIYLGIAGVFRSFNLDFRI
jgi:cytochrome P450